MAVRVISDESWIVSQQTDTKHFDIMQDCLETLLSNTAQSYHLTVFLQLSNMHFWPYMKEVL